MYGVQGIAQALLAAGGEERFSRVAAEIREVGVHEFLVEFVDFFLAMVKWEIFGRAGSGLLRKRVLLSS